MIKLNVRNEIKESEDYLSKLGVTFDQVMHNKHNLVGEDSDTANFEAGKLSVLREIKQKRFARKCDECGKLFNEGYCVHEGQEYFCSDECLHKHYSEDEWCEMYSDGDGDSYHTTWEDEDDYLYYEDGSDIEKPEPKDKVIFLDIKTTGLKPWYGDKITCICAKSSEPKMIFKKTLGETDLCEKKLIDKFFEWLSANKFKDDYTLVTKNGKEFDIPFILTRYCMKNKDLMQKESSMAYLLLFDHFDLHEITKKRVSLQSMAELLGLDGKSGTGENAIKLAEEGRWSELREYCWQDVEVTESVFFKLKEIHEGRWQ